MLAHTLEGAASQITESEFSFEIVVVDNDSQRSAEDIVSSFQKNKDLHIIYDCEPEQNISLARNRAVRNARGDFIAFIDDDEYPEANWLINLYHTLKKYNADGILGPVLPFYPQGTPLWLKKSGLCERSRKTTGSFITSKDMRIGNILIQRYVFEKNGMWFDPERGRTGGEDGEFLLRQISRGRRFVWCDEGVVFETVPEERWHLTFYIKKEFRIGTLNGERFRLRRRVRSGTKVFFLFIVYSFLLLFSFIAGKHVWVKVSAKLSYNMGFLLSQFGVSLLRYRK
jgi:glycosyltransferase involved in cell wall biosynthesis